MPHNKILKVNHRACTIDINLEDYFNEERSSWDSMNHVMLGLAKRSYYLRFAEELEEQPDH